MIYGETKARKRPKYQKTMDNQQLSPEQGKAQRPSDYGVGVQAIGTPKWYTRNLREDMV